MRPPPLTTRRDGLRRERGRIVGLRDCGNLEIWKQPMAVGRARQTVGRDHRARRMKKPSRGARGSRRTGKVFLSLGCIHPANRMELDNLGNAVRALAFKPFQRRDAGITLEDSPKVCGRGVSAALRHGVDRLSKPQTPLRRADALVVDFVKHRTAECLPETHVGVPTRAVHRLRHV